MEKIKIVGLSQNNLKNISLTIPFNRKVFGIFFKKPGFVKGSIKSFDANYSENRGKRFYEQY